MIDRQTSKIPEFTNLRPQSKIHRINKNIALQFWEFIEKKIHVLERDMFPSTAEGDGLEEWGKSRGVQRIQLARSTGKVLVGSSIAPDKLYTVAELFIVGTPGSADQEALIF